MNLDISSVVVTFAVYLLLVLAIGLWASRKTTNSADYFLGGRSLGPWPVALSAGASDMSGWLLLGLPGYAYAAGLESLWMVLGLFVGTYLNWRLVARRLRSYSVLADDALTLPEFFANRFDGDTRILQVLAALFILLFYLFYTSAGLVAGGKLFSSVFGLDYELAVLIGAACVVCYTFLGGFLAVSWTDLIQGLLMAAALLIVPLVTMELAGGAGQSWAALEQRNPELLNLWSNVEGQALSWIAIVSLFGWGLGYFGQPHILVRFKSIRSTGELPAARRIAIGWTLVSMLGAVAVGLFGSVYVDANPALVMDDSEKIFMALVQALFHPLVAGVLLAAILAAIMSTADSQLLVSSSAFTEDLYRTLLRPQASVSEVVMVARGAVIVISLIALGLALDPAGSVLGLSSYAWAGFGATFGPVLLLSLYWSRMNRAGALAGILVGGVTVVIWKPLQGGLFDLYELVPGFLGALLAIVVVTLVTAKPKEKTLAVFKQAVSKP